LADETSVPPENGKHISVTRMSVGSAEVKDMHVDLLEAVNLSIQEQTETISRQNERILRQGEESSDQQKKASKQEVGADQGVAKEIRKLQEINQELIAAIRSGIGGDDAGSAAGGIAQAELKSHQVGLEAINNANKANRSLTKTVESLKEVLEAERQVISGSLMESLVHLTRELVSFRSAVSKVNEAFRETLELSKSGMADFSDIIFDSMSRSVEYIENGFEGTRDNLLETSRLVKSSLQEGLVSPMVLVNGNLKETAGAFHKFRNDLEEGGLDLYRNLGFREQNQVLAKLLDAQLRGDRMMDISDSNVRKQTAEQIETLRVIAENSGLSLDELVKSNDAPMTIAQLQSSGALSDSQAANLLPALSELKNVAPDMVNDLVQAFAAGDSRAVFEAHNQQMAQDYRVQGVDIFQVAQDLKNKTSTGIREGMVSLGHQLADTFKEDGTTARFRINDYEKFNRMATSSNALKKLDPNRGTDSVVTKAFNQFENWYTNKFPAFDALSLITSIGANTFALVANTGALGLNTVAHWKSGALGKLGGMIGSVARVAGKMLKFGGIAAGVAMVGKDLYDTASGDASGENIGGVVGGVIGGGIGALTGPLAPLAIPAGIMLGNMAGNFLGGKFDEANAAATPSASPITAPAAGMTAAAVAGGGKTGMSTNMVSQTRLLENIAGSLNTNNTLQREIRDRIGFGSSSNLTQRDATKKGSNIAVVPGRLGS